MSTLIQYRRLFTVRIIPEYHFPEEPSLYSNLTDEARQRLLNEQLNTYDLSEDFLISPTKATKVLLNQNKLVFKQEQLGFFIACKVDALNDGTFVPFHPLDEAFSLNFTLSLKNHHFINFSNIPLNERDGLSGPYIYYFSNRANNVVADGTESLPYISLPVPGFDDSLEYKAGQIILDPGGGSPIMREAIEANGPGPFDTANWQEIYGSLDTLPQFATEADRRVLRPSIFKYNVAAVAQEVLNFIVRNQEGNIVSTQQFITSETGTPLSECEIDLRGVKNGLLSLEVRDGSNALLPELSLEFYLDSILFQTRPFALIECAHEPDGSLGDYRWLDHNNDDRLLNPEYLLRWKNRSTFWRYYFTASPNYTSTQVTNYDSNINSPNHRILVSNDPLGLAFLSRRVEVEIGGESIFLPNPEVNSIFPENGRVYSEINMGGGLGPPQ